MSQNIWQIETLSKIKKSTVLTDFFIKQRLLSIPGVGIEWSGEIEKLIMEMLLLRCQAKRSRDFERSDAYCFVLIRLGLDMMELDMEMRPSRTTPQDLLEGK